MNYMCPKCGSQCKNSSCPTCGLTAGKTPQVESSLNVPSEVAVLWQNTLQHWEDVSAHTLFLENGLRHHAAGYIAACYRSKGDDPIALAQLDKLTARLMQTLRLQVETNSPSLNWMKTLVYVLLFLLLAFMVFLILHNS